MADKKSFVMYTNWGTAVSMMSNEQAGALFKAVYEYQTNPDAKPSDPAVAFVFEIFRQRFDEDSERYQKACDAKSEAAKKGNSSRGKKRISEDDTAYASISEDDTAYAEICEKKSASEGDNDSDTDNDTESDNDNESESDYESGKEKKEKPLKRLPSRGAKREGKADRNAELFSRLSAGHGYPPNVTEKLLEWMQYKGKAKGDEYEETGMRSLLTILDAKLREYGEEAVCGEITDAMANGWKGIQWTRLDRPRGRQQPRTDNYSDLMEAW